MRRFLVVLLLGVAAVAEAQHPNEERGFSPERVYDLHDLDSVNSFNGNLVVRIPIGPEYKVNGRLGYQLHLTYNSHIWRFATNDGVYNPDDGDVQVIAYPIGSFNAGLGWRFSLGKLFEAGDPDQESTGGWTYQSDDGADHAFYGDPHSAGTASFPRYSRDGTYLRLTSVDATTMKIEFPDGTAHTFQQLAPLTPPQNGTWPPSSTSHQWFLTAMADTFGNSVSLSYSTTGTYPEIWTISDGARTNTAYFVDSQLPARSLDHIDTKSVGGATATYRFTVQVWNIPPAYGDTTGRPSVPVALLTGITPPAGNPYTMMLNGQPAYDTSALTSGELTRLTLPTLGSIGWSYEPFSMVGIFTPSPKRSHAIDRPVMVKTRTKYDALGSDAGTWTYGRRLASNQPHCPVTCPNGSSGCFSGRGRQVTRWVTEPSTGSAPKTTINYFSAYEFQLDPYGDTCSTLQEGWLTAEHGLPFTRFATRSEGNATRFLSSEIRTGFDESTVTNSGWNGQGRVPTSGTVLRESYVTYAVDCDVANDNESFDHNAALTSTATYFSDMGCGANGNEQCYVATNYSAPDGYGHYRQASTNGNFPGSANFRTTFTNYNPSLPPPSCSTNPTPPSSWVLNTSTEQCVAEETTARAQDSVGNCASLTAFTTKTQFDSRGALTGKRTLKRVDAQQKAVYGELDPADLLATFSYDGDGNLTSEAYAGGEAQPISTTATFPSTVPTYTIAHSLTYDTTCPPPFRCPLIRDLATYSNSVVSSDVEFDPSTHLPTLARDISGLPTSYSYDILNRITAVSPPGVAPTTYTYVAAAVGSVFSPSKVLATTDASAYGLGAIGKEYHYDAFGRLWRQKTLLDDSSWSIVQNDYDALGRKIAVSMPEKLTVAESSFVPAHKTSFTLDSFDRPVSIQAPDSTTTTIAYTNNGTREVKRTVSVATGAACAPAMTTEVHDAVGRLVKVTEPSGDTGASNPCGTDTDTSYAYDAADHLATVTTGVQARQFTYDGRGLLTSEQHPELGQNGNGSISYVYNSSSIGYDARGHSLGKLSGSLNSSFDLRFAYDAAERLTDITDNGGSRQVKHFDFYATTAGLGSRSRVQTAARYNRIPAITGDVVVSETYTYDSSSGRASHRDTLVEKVSGGVHTTLQTFGQDFHYDRLASLAQLDYPTCATWNCTATPASGMVAYTRTNGFLKTVSGYASSLTYNPDGSVFEVGHSGTVKDTYTPDPNGMSRPFTISVNGVQNCGSGPTATVSGGGTINPGGSATIQVALTGTAPWTVTWSDGLTDPPVTTSPTTRSVSPPATTQYTVTNVTDGTGCSAVGTGSATVTVNTLAAPTGLLATTQANTLQVLIRWDGVTGAAWYQVQRATRIRPGDWRDVGGHVTATSYIDMFTSTADPVTYLYRVMAGVTTNGTDSLSPSSNLDYATIATTLFTDDPISGNSTRIMGRHYGELRHAIDAVRYAAGLLPAWSSYAPLTGGISVSDNITMRNSLDEAVQALVGHNVSYSETPAINMRIRSAHVNEIRDGVR